MFHLRTRAAYKTLNTIYLNSAALTHNHDQLQKLHPTTAICPVLKSNAYGHGLTTIAPLMDKLACPYLCVDSLFEAYELLKIDIKTKILILGYTNPINFQVKRLPFEYAVYDLALATALNHYQPGCAIHLFIDTGMCREGITLADLPLFLDELKKLKHLKVVGVISHLADADNPTDQTSMLKQVEQFKQAIKLITAAGHDVQWRQLANSAGSLNLPNSLDQEFNLIRAGLAHYGLSPLSEKKTPKQLQLQPVLRFCSTIVQIKTIQPGEKVGYNGTFTAPKEMRIAILPAGYYEGVDRRLSNLGVVKVGETFCPILGRVSMNMTVIDVSQVKFVKVGDEVTIFSDHPQDPNSVAHAAATAGTIPYDLLVHLAESVRRVS